MKVLKSVCLLVSNRRQNGRTYWAQNYKKLSQKIWTNCIILKSTKKYYEICKLCFCFLSYKEKILSDKATIISWNREDGSEAPWKLVYTIKAFRLYIFIFIYICMLAIASGVTFVIFIFNRNIFLIEIFLSLIFFLKIWF